MIQVGLIPIAAKPYHRGHYNLVETAIEECQEILLFVGLADRDNISGVTMQKIWKYIEAELPTSVKMQYGGSPIKNMYKFLGNVENDKKSFHNVKFIIYGGEDELSNDVEERFPKDILQKHYPNLFLTGQLDTRSVNRVETTGISGTKMRELLRFKKKEEFIAGLPDFMHKYQDEIWDIFLS